MLAMASAMARRAEAGASTTATGGRSPRARASPAKPSKDAAATAQSATGVCQGPTIWSCATSPDTLRSAMVTRKRLSATAGSCSVRAMASSSSTGPRSEAPGSLFADAARNARPGGWPRSIPKGRSMGLVWFSWSVTTSRPVSLVAPRTAQGARSRRQSLTKSSSRAGAKARTYRSCASLHHSASGERPGSSLGMFRNSNSAPRLPSWTSSGKALDKPPAPTSWMDRMGLSPSRAQHWSMTSWQRRCISALSLCTEAKSSSESPAPAPWDDAAPPPKPISMAGPPNTTILLPGGMARLKTWAGRATPQPPANMMGLW